MSGRLLLKREIRPAFLPGTALVNSHCHGMIFNNASFYSQSAPILDNKSYDNLSSKSLTKW